MTEVHDAQSRLEHLRLAFDESFAAPAHEAVRDVEDFVAVRVGDVAYAVRLAEVTGVFPLPPLVEVSPTTPGLRGLAGLRGEVIPVFALGAFLGVERDAGDERWILLTGRPRPIGFAVARFDGHLRVPKAHLRAAAHSDASSRVSGFVHTDSGSVGVIALTEIVTTIRGRRASRQPKEQ